MTLSTVAHDTFVVERTYNAPVAEVFRCITEVAMEAHQKETRAVLWHTVPDSVEELRKERVAGRPQPSFDHIDDGHGAVCVWGPENPLNVLH